MKFHAKFIILTAGLALLHTGCRNHISDSVVCLDNVESFDRFPLSVDIGSADTLDLPTIGHMTIDISDDYMTLATSDVDSCWAVYKLPSMELIGRLLSCGGGPGEFVYPPECDMLYRQNPEKNLHIITYDAPNRRVADIDITASIDSGKVIQQECRPDYLNSNVVSITPIDSNSVLLNELSDDFTRLNRLLISNGKATSNHSISKLNSYGIEHKKGFIEPNRINALGRITVCNPNLRRIAEVPISMSQISIYSLDDDFAKTIAPSNRLDDYTSFIDKPSDTWPQTYITAKAFNDFFAAVYAPKSATGNNDLGPAIQFFNWDGKPIAELRLPFEIRSIDFDIDFTDNVLYLLDNHNDILTRHDIADLLDKISANQ